MSIRQKYTVGGTFNDSLRLDLKLTSNFLPSTVKLFSENINLTFSGALSFTFSVRLKKSIRIAKKSEETIPILIHIFPAFYTRHTLEFFLHYNILSKQDEDIA